MPSVSIAQILGLSLALLPFAASSVAADDASLEGRAIAETLFASMDTRGKGLINAGDLEDFRDSVFAGMDSDADRRVTYAEFVAWDPGFASVAQKVGRTEAHITATKIIYAFWDRDGDGGLTEREMRLSVGSDFRRADFDGDAFLSKDEFLQGFPIIVAMRAAIRPDL